MYSFEQFDRDFKAAYTGDPLYLNALGNSLGCYSLYTNAHNCALEFLVAGRIIRPGLAIGINDDERINFGTTHTGREGEWDYLLNGQGAVLHSEQWSLPMNDAWILGGVHAKLPFYLA